MHTEIPSIALTTPSGKIQILHEGNTMPRTFGRRRTAEIKRIQQKVFHITSSEEDLERTLFYRKPQQEEDEEEGSDTESTKSQQTDTASVETIKPRTMKKLRKILTIKIPRSNFITMRIPRPNIDGTVHPPTGNTTMRKIKRKLSDYF